MADEETNHSDISSTSTSPLQQNEDVGGGTETSSKFKGSQKNRTAIHYGVKTFYGRNPGSKASGSCSKSKKNIGGISIQGDKVGASLQDNEYVGGSTKAKSKFKGSQKNKTAVYPRVRTFWGQNPGSKASGSRSKSSDSPRNKKSSCPGVRTFYGRNPGSKASGSRSKPSDSPGNKKSSCTGVKTFYGRNPGSKASGHCSRSDDVGGSTGLLSDTRDIGERRNQCKDVTHFIQSSSPENVDANRLSPEVGGGTLTRSKSKGFHENNKSIHPGVKTFYGQNPGSKASRSSSRSGDNVGEISGKVHKVGGNSSLTQNVGVQSGMVQNVTEFSGPPQNMPDLIINSCQQSPTFPHSLVQTVEGGLFLGQEGLHFASKTSSSPHGLQFLVQNTAASCPPSSRIVTRDFLQTSSQTCNFPAPVKNDHPPSPLPRENPPHISQDLNELPSPSRGECFLCHSDLSLPPEDPIIQSALRPVTSVLPCHHHFHAQCLEIVTPTDQSKCPPCIQCQVDMQVQSSSSSRQH